MPEEIQRQTFFKTCFKKKCNLFCSTHVFPASSPHIHVVISWAPLRLRNLFLRPLQDV